MNVRGPNHFPRRFGGFDGLDQGMGLRCGLMKLTQAAPRGRKPGEKWIEILAGTGRRGDVDTAPHLHCGEAK